MLQDKQKPGIQSKCWDLLLKGVLLLHDNVYLHSTAYNVQIKVLEDTEYILIYQDYIYM